MNDNDFATNLGNRIRELRKNKGVSQLELAYDMDMSMNTISGIELGKISPKIDTLKKIAQKLDIDISELFDFSEHAPKDKVIRKKVEEITRKLLPQDKVTEVEKLLEATHAAGSGKGKLAFVGDGINDAPVLRRADIGIAMGAMGSDAAIEAADVVLMDDDPMKIAKAIRISRKCLRIVYENIVFAIGIKLICLVLGALGLANMWLAIFADVGVMILAVLNAIRALFVKNL